MEPKFKVGDIVVLKSGGPKMTINRVIKKRNMTADFRGFTDDFEGMYECKWFEENKAKEGDYHENTLVAG